MGVTQSVNRSRRAKNKSSCPKEAWLASGLPLDQRIALGLPEAMKIIRMDCSRPEQVDEFRGLATDLITAISLVAIDPSQHRQKKALLECAAKVREGWMILGAYGPVLWTPDYYYILRDLCIEIENDAARIEDRRGGGTDMSRKQNHQKRLSVEYASSLIRSFGRCGPPTVTEGKPLLQLSKLMFEIATGNITRSLKKAALAQRAIGRAGTSSAS
ncbi:hypothetical protein ACVWWO_006190 [Bradyrhizobium sp. F1.13.1]